VFFGNNSQPTFHPSNTFHKPAFSGAAGAPRPPTPVAQVQPSAGYSDIDKIERRINNNVERMINGNMRRMIRMMTE